jgi:hypothetical protein
VNPDKFRREFMRWILILTLNNARPDRVMDGLLLAVVRGEFADATRNEVRRELDYLKSRALVEIAIPPDGGDWKAELTRAGVDIAEYTVPVEPGIARPVEKYY